MGCAPSKHDGEPDREGFERNADIDNRIRMDKKDLDRTVKILLLGAGESGKSTIIKQMRIIHAGGFRIDERKSYRAVIYSNMVMAFKLLLDIMRSEEIEFERNDTMTCRDIIAKQPAAVNADDAFSRDEVRIAMKKMWLDGGVQKAVTKGHEFALHDNLSYYFKSLDRMFDPGWMPDNQDMLHSRLQTTGITETVFALGHLNFQMMDVGGQRSERKKWIHCFESVQCLLFMVSLSGYDQCLVEDQNTNQMHESMALFESLVNSEWFRRKPIIVFFNKIDLFREKLALSPISAHFPDYRGADTDYDAGVKYFADRFRGINRTGDREIYVHYTNATDTTLLEATMQSVHDMIIQKNLNSLILWWVSPLHLMGNSATILLKDNDVPATLVPNLSPHLREKINQDDEWSGKVGWEVYIRRRSQAIPDLLAHLSQWD